MKWMNPCLIVSLVLLILAVSSSWAVETSARKPNFVYIIVDDLGVYDLGCYGGKAIATPNIDRLAAEGMRFTQAYAGCTVCAPSRATLITGLHGGHAPVRGNTGGVWIADEDVTIAEVLRPAGYISGGYGKWGIADVGTPGVPEKQGFSDFFGYYHQIHAHDFYPEYLWRNGEKVELPGNRGFTPGKGPGPVDTKADGKQRQFSQYLIVDEALKFIRANKDRQFFCYLPWTPPHGHFVIPQDDPAWAMYKDRDWPMKAKVHAAYTTMVDRQVGQVMALLKELGIDENTVVFFCSDNGASDRFEGSLNSAGSLRGFKTKIYDGGLRTPLIARWPGKIAPGSTSDHVCYFPDIMPTLAEFAGAAAPSDIDGISLVPTLLGRGEQKPHDYLYWEWVGYNWNGKPLNPNLLAQAIRVGDYKLVRETPKKPWELYDLAADPGETRDLATDQPDRVAKMAKLIAEVRTEPRPQLEPKMPPGKKYR